MELHKRINAFAKLTNFMKALATENESIIDSFLFDEYEELLELIRNYKIKNPWFTEEFIKRQFLSLSEVTDIKQLTEWISPYKKSIDSIIAKRVGVIMAGNIPLVGFHDFLSVLITGHIFVGKVSSKDEQLPKKIAEILIKIEPEFEKFIYFCDQKLSEFDAIIATGSNNTSRYFEYYFGKVHNIIRKSRNSIAILTGNETDIELELFADDILLYFGLGCRNISKVFVPNDYNFDRLFNALYKYKDLINHNKYANNYDYNNAIYLLNGDKFLDNGFFMIKQDVNIASPISVLHYEFYDRIEEIENFVELNKDKIQCVVSKIKSDKFETVDNGEAQKPKLDDYEDGINTIEFLLNL